MNTYQRFEAVDIQRTQIKNAPYNPRKIDTAARAKLEQSLKEFGLVETLVWNRRTGNLVGGHQRLALLDDLHAADIAKQPPPEALAGMTMPAPDPLAYELTVAAVDLEPDREKALNVVLNSKEAQGRYDTGLLDSLLAEIDKKALGGFDLNAFIAGAGKRTKDKTAAIAYEVIVKCRDEIHRSQVMDELATRGYDCRARDRKIKVDAPAPGTATATP